MTKLLREKVTVSCWIPILLLSCIRVFAGGSNDIPAWFIKPGSVWGDETNRVCAVVELQGRQDSQQVTAFLVSSDTNANWQYVAPPKVKFTKVELRDTNGVVVNPVPGRRLDGNLPARIPIKELPRYPERGTRQRGSGGGLMGVLNFAREPATLQTFSMRDVYRIEQEGDYTLTICPAIYHYSQESEFVTRMDLPCVTTTVHLVPEQKGE